jgi:hypothetical protein
MVRSLPKVYLHWREPVEASQAREILAWRAKSWWMRAFMIFALVGGPALHWWFAVPVVVLSPAYLMGVGYFFLCSALRGRVVVHEQWVACFYGAWRHPQFIRYRDLDRCRIIAHRRSRQCPILVLELRRGEPLLIGVDPAIALGELEEALRRCGVPVTVEEREEAREVFTARTGWA